MNQSPADLGEASPPSPASGHAVLRRRNAALIALAVAAAIPAGQFALPWEVNVARNVIAPCLVALIFAGVHALYRVEMAGGRLTLTEFAHRARSADLTQLASVTTTGTSERWSSRRYLVLRDRQGAYLQLNFFLTPRGPRQELLAALEPYVMAGGVSRDGLVAEALSGELWRGKGQVTA